MAKISLTKLGFKVDQSVSEIKFGENAVEVKNYLPISDKLDLISNVINAALDNNGFYNPMKVKIFFVLEVIDFYTNLKFTEKQKEDPLKLYDLMINSGLFTKIRELIGTELDEIRNDIEISIKNIYKYRNSVLGVLEAISTDYSEINEQANEIQERLSNEENLTLLKDIMTKLG